MPRTGMPRARTCGLHLGAWASYTELGPPDKMMPAGANLRISSNEELQGRTAENTCCSRMRRAMSCVYWPPKSRTTTPPTSEFGFACASLIVAPVAIGSPSGNALPYDHHCTFNAWAVGAQHAAPLPGTASHLE